MFDVFSGKMGKNINCIVGLSVGFIRSGNSFAFVVDPFTAEDMKIIFIDIERDFDVLQESLGNNELILSIIFVLNSFNCISGAINSEFYVSSEYYVPERTQQKIDTATRSMMESGLYAFYNSLTQFRLEMNRQVHSKRGDDEDNDDIKALTIEQLMRPMMIIFCLWGASVALFIVEHFVFRWNQWRNRSRGN